MYSFQEFNLYVYIQPGKYNKLDEIYKIMCFFIVLSKPTFSPTSSGLY